MSIISGTLTRTLTIFIISIFLDTKPRDVHEPRRHPSTFIAHNPFTCKPLAPLPAQALRPASAFDDVSHVCRKRRFRRDGFVKRKQQHNNGPRRPFRRNIVQLYFASLSRAERKGLSATRDSCGKDYRTNATYTGATETSRPSRVVRFHVWTVGLFRSIFRRVCLYPPSVRVRQLKYTSCTYKSVRVFDARGVRSRHV